MRYVLAIASLVLAGVLLVLGVGQRTFLAGPAEITAELGDAPKAGYAVIAGSELQKMRGQANVVVQGDGAFVATGAARDVSGWVEPFDHARVAFDAKSGELVAKMQRGVQLEADQDEADQDAAAGQDPAAEGTDAADSAEPEETKPLDPRGSDMWLEEKSTDGSSGTLRVPVKLEEDQAVLIASNGTDPLPSRISIAWVQDRATPWAGPLLVAGGVFALLGGVLYLLAFDHDHRGRGPRRGRRGPLLGLRNVMGGRRRRTAAAERRSGGAGAAGQAAGRAERRTLRRALPVIGLTAALGLTGCSADYWPQPAPAQEEAPTPSKTAPVPVTEGQLKEIVKRVSDAAQAGDDALSAEEITGRFTGDALAQREANYKIRSTPNDYKSVPPRITDDLLDYELVQSTESWPRTLFVTVASEKEKGSTESSPSLALVLTQRTPQENYLVSYVFSLRGGISMPKAAPAEEGTALLANDLESLAMQPGQVGDAFAAVMQQGDAAPEAELFETADDKLLQNYGKALTERFQAESPQVSFSLATRAGDNPPVALSTGAGGALVATTVIEEQVATAGSGGLYKPTATGAVTALSGLSGQQESLVTEIAHQLLFFVPSKKDSDAKIQLLGVTSELVGARN